MTVPAVAPPVVPVRGEAEVDVDPESAVLSISSNAREPDRTRLVTVPSEVLFSGTAAIRAARP